MESESSKNRETMDSSKSRTSVEGTNNVENPEKLSKEDGDALEQSADTVGVQGLQMFEIDTEKKNVSAALKVLQDSEDYSSQKSVQAFEAITLASVDESRRQAIGDYLAQIGYAELYTTTMQWIKASKASQNNENWDEPKFVAEMMGGFWNFSDGSSLLCQRFGKCGVTDILFEDLKDVEVAQIAVKQLKATRKRHHLFAKLGILHNCIRLCSDNRAIYRKANAVSILTNFLQAPNVAVYVKTICLLILAYIVDETESEKLASSGAVGCLTFLIKLLRKALNSDIQRYGGFSTCELLEGIHHLSLNDTNKVKSVQSGCLPLMTQMMKPGYNEEGQLLAARGVWRLAFAPSNKKIIQEEVALLQALEHLQKSSQNQYIRKICTGALWEIYDGKITLLDDEQSVDSAKLSPVKDQKKADGPHVLISYQWDIQLRMVILKDLLISHGYNVWMDIDKMEGNILSAMASAVENAAVVLVCVSQKYKDSESCRTEASYAYKKKKIIVPLMVEKKYEPDGWLGALIGVRLYFSMYTDDQVHTKLPSLLQELGVRGRSEASEIGSEDVDGQIKPADMPTSTNMPPIASPGRNIDSLRNWTSEQLQTWLQDIGMQDLKPHLSYCNGKHLIQMYKQCRSCPEYFHSALRQDLKIDFHTVLKLTTSLEQLFQGH